MKFLQKTWVAWLLTAVMIAAAVGIGQVKGGRREPEPLPTGSAALDESLSTKQFADYIWDEAGVLSSKQEEQICLYNANWNQRYESIIAVAAVKSADGNLDDYAYDLGEEIELASADGILVIDVSAKDAYLAVGPDYPLTDGQVTSYMDNSMYEYVQSGDYGSGVLNLFKDLNTYYVDNYGLGYRHQRHRPQPLQHLPPAILRRGQSSGDVPAHLLLARAGHLLVPAALASASPAPAPQGAGPRSRQPSRRREQLHRLQRPRRGQLP